MVKRDDNIFADDIQGAASKRVSKIIDYASTTGSHPTTPTTDNLTHDDLIMALAEAHENKRARQVFEWETVRRNSFRKAA